MAVTIHDDMWEVAGLYEDSAGFIYALVSYAETGEEPGRDAPWYPSFVAFRDRLTMSADAHRRGKKGGRPRNPQVDQVNNLNAKEVSNQVSETSEKRLETPSEKGFANRLETEKRGVERSREEKRRGECDARAPEQPTVEEIAAYSDANGLGIDAQAFHDYHAAQGWVLANGNPVLDWQAAARRWAAEDRRRRHDKPDGDLDARFARFDAIDAEVIAS